MLKPVAHRIMTHELGMNRTAGELALAGVGVYTQLLAHLSSVLGEAGSQALFRSSLRLSPFPCLKEIRAQDPQALRGALHTSLQQQEPEVVVEMSIAQFTSFLELLATFVGERLTCELLAEVWPDLITIPPREIRHE